MKKLSSLTIDKIRFYAYSCDETFDLDFPELFDYDDRHDFLVDRSFRGILVRILLVNDSYVKGARRTVSLQLMDVTSRCEVDSRNLKVNIPNNKFFWGGYVDFSTETTDIRPGHTYKLIVSDLTASRTLTERVIHLYNKADFPHPAKWYEICEGGIRPAWENDMYRNLYTIDNRDYYVRFNLAQNFGRMLPAVMPELELRLCYPDGRSIITRFNEPKCRDRRHYDSNSWFVEFLFSTSGMDNGMFYAELLCMKHPVAGFVFDTKADEEPGTWYGPDIMPVEGYTTDANFAAEAFSDAGELSRDTESIDFDRLLDSFLADGDDEE